MRNFRKTAYQLSHGQPLLLQTLGATLIDNFIAAVFEGKERSNEVFRIVERLTDEVQFIRGGEAYRFTVPIYRRWVGLPGAGHRKGFDRRCLAKQMPS
jgi:hypothetical protein